MNRTKIEWCDWTWNPIVGCSPASVGCANCYAAAIARRFGMPWGRPRFFSERLGEPSRVKKPGRIFVCSMSDVGHERVCPLWRAEIRKAIEWLRQRFNHPANPCVDARQARQTTKEAR